MRLIRRFVFWFAEYFPFLFPLLLAAFFLVHINTAFAADEIPAGSVPAGSCTLWEAGPYLSGASKGTGCSPAEAIKNAKAKAGLTWPNHYCSADWYKDCATLAPEVISPTVSRVPVSAMYCNDWGLHGTTVRHCGSSWIPVTYREDAATKVGTNYFCPPDNNASYTIGPLTKDDGTKWCAKAAAVNACEDKADTQYSTPVHFYSLNLSDGLMPTCKEGCEVQSSGTGTCQSITLPSGTKANRCLFSSAVFTGSACPYETGQEPATGTGEDVGTPEQPSTSQEDCVPTYNAATGTTSCTGVKNTENPGTSSCGTVNGTWTCVPNNDGGSSTTTDQREIINSTDPVTGNTTTTDRTTSTTVTCKGADCTSTAKTTTTTTVKGPDGSVISSSTGCVGSGCGSGAPGDPDAEGDELTPPEYPSMPNPDEFTDSVNDALQGYEDGVMGHFERDDYEHMTTIDDGTADSVAGAITASMGSGCTNPVIPVGPWSFTVDMCYYAEKIRPYLDFLCVMLTLIYLWHLLRDAIYNTGA